MPPFLRALGSRNYRLYFVGQLVSMAGTWMQQIAMIWLAYRLSNSAFVLGTVGFASQIPILIFASLGGVWLDRLDRRRVMMWTQTLAMAQALVLAVLAWLEWVSPGILILMAFLLGCINAVDVPARQAIAARLVDRPEDLPNAIALNSFLMNAGRFVGPALAGFVVAMLGEALCFLLNAGSYLAVLLALGAMRMSFQGGRPSPAFEALREGYRYAIGQPAIRRSLLLVSAISFFATPYAVMLPLYAREIFGGDASTYGLLVASAGAGSLAGSLFLATREDTQRLGHWVSLAAPAVGACLALFAHTPEQWLAYPVLTALGLSVIVTIAGSNTLIQTQVDEAFRGRVMSIFSTAFLGIAPLGSLAVGSLAHAVGIRPTLTACGLAALAAGALYRRAVMAQRRQEAARAQP